MEVIRHQKMAGQAPTPRPSACRSDSPEKSRSYSILQTQKETWSAAAPKIRGTPTEPRRVADYDEEMKSKPGGKLRRGQYERVFKRGVAEAALSRKRIAQMTADEYLAAVAAAQNAASGRPEERLSELLSRRSA